MCRKPTEALSEYVLERYLHGLLDSAARSRVEGHVQVCEHCRQRLELAGERGAHFKNVVLAQTLPSLRETAGRRRSFIRSPQWQLAAGLCAAICAVVLLFDPAGLRRTEERAGLTIPEGAVQPQPTSPTAPREDDPTEPHRPADEGTYTGTKGGALARIYVQRLGRGVRVSEDMTLRSGEALRIIPDAEGFSHIYVLSVTDDGTVSPLYPYEWQASMPLPGAPGEPLPGSIILDDTVGAETFWIVLSGRPVRLAEFRQWSRNTGGELRRGDLPILDDDVKALSLRIRKVR